MAHVVTAPISLRSLYILRAVTILATRGDITRFETPRPLMSVLGRVPSAGTRASHRRRGQRPPAGRPADHIPRLSDPALPPNGGARVISPDGVTADPPQRRQTTRQLAIHNRRRPHHTQIPGPVNSMKVGYWRVSCVGLWRFAVRLAPDLSRSAAGDACLTPRLFVRPAIVAVSIAGMVLRHIAGAAFVRRPKIVIHTDKHAGCAGATIGGVCHCHHLGGPHIPASVGGGRDLQERQSADGSFGATVLGVRERVLGTIGFGLECYGPGAGREDREAGVGPAGPTRHRDGADAGYVSFDDFGVPLAELVVALRRGRQGYGGCQCDGQGRQPPRGGGGGDEVCQEAFHSMDPFSLVFTARTIGRESPPVKPRRARAPRLATVHTCIGDFIPVVFRRWHRAPGWPS